VLTGCGRMRGYESVTDIGSPGDLASTYKIPAAGSGLGGIQFLIRAAEGPDGGKSRFSTTWYPQSVGAAQEALLGNRLVMRLELAEPDTYEITFHQDLGHPLGEKDGLVAGRIERTIHAGKSLTVKVQGLGIQAITGPEDTYLVLTDSAKLRVGGKVRELPKGEYAASAVLW